ncbi:hypothetical protein DU52_01540 [Methanosarcina mazei]|uniref:DUF2206 domain-containing protein n=1 Tax=Methanosarcina mazei TaxID=2209 RepID=A0A0F8GA65_METMZ|nr:hypothetical protein [Methanosarcina mazei]KKG29100.1 hypothetical protein DU52_01540 [Methanosarcina mazei]
MKNDQVKYSDTVNILSKLAVSLPYLIVIAILIGFLFAGIMGRLDFAIRGLVIAVPAVISAKILRGIYKNKIEFENISISFGLTQKQLIYLFFTVYFSSLSIIFISSTRTWLYLIVISLLYFIILIQVFSTDFNPNFILLQNILCMLNLIYSVTLKYPLYFGGTDILPHIFMSQVTYISGHTIPQELSVGYANFPLFHILISQASYMLGLDISTSYFLLCAPVFSLSSLFIYSFLVKIIENVKLSLLTVILYSNLSVVIYYGMYVITRNLAFIGFLVLLYIVSKSKNNMVFRFFGIIFTLFIILVHQVSTPQILAVILLLSMSEKFIAHCTNLNKKYWSSSYIFLFVVLFLGYWFYLAYSFTSTVLATRFDSVVNDAVQIKGSVIAGNEWIFLYNNIDTSIITFFIVIGIGATLWKYGKNYSAVFSFASLLFLPLYLPNPLQTLWQTMTLFRFDRFMLLISPFIAFSMASGVFFLYAFLRMKHIKCLHISLLILTLLMVFIVPSLFFNNPEVGLNTDRKYFTYEELTGFNYVLNYIPYGSNLYSDYYTERYFCHKKFKESDELGLPYYNSQTIRSMDAISIHDGYFILKNKAFLERGLNLGGVDSKFYLTKYDLSEWNKLNLELNKKNKIYYSSCVSIFDT